MTACARVAPILLLTATFSDGVSGQTFDGPGTRAQGMGGAFVAVADDASAVYWNPGALARGAYFSLLIDRTDAATSADDPERAAQRSAWLVALSAPVVGLSYYRLHHATALPAAEPGFSRVESLVTHHTGATLVQSLTDTIAVGATAKLVRGVAHVSTGQGDAEALLDDLELGVAGTDFDVDVGVVAAGSLLRAGLTVRNLLEPEFETVHGEPLGLDRQARLGLAVLLTDRWTAALDVDLTRNRGAFGDVRTLAIGAEGRVGGRAVARGGVQFNTTGGSRDPSASLGASYAVFGALLVDAHFSTGSDAAYRGWGLAGRVAF
jgi:hypothetical protein